MTIAPPNPPQPTEPDQSTDWHRPMLRAMAELVMQVADATAEQAIRQAQAAPAQTPETAPEPEQPNAAGLLLPLLARTLRQLVALDARLAAPPRTPTHTAAADQARHETLLRQRRNRDRVVVRRQVAAALHAAENLANRESLLADLNDHLNDDDIDTLLATRTVPEIVRDLCAQLGIPADIVQSAAQAEQPPAATPPPAVWSAPHPQSAPAPSHAAPPQRPGTG